MSESSQNNTENGKLLPCLCGGEASVKVLEYGDGCKVWGVFCEADLASEYSHGHFIDNYATEAEAIAAWNTRAERTCRNDSLKRDAGVFVCSECGIYLDIADMNWDGEDDSGGFYDPNYCPNCGAKVVVE